MDARICTEIVSDEIWISSNLTKVDVAIYDLSTLSNGIYFLRLEDKTNRIIKQSSNNHQIIIFKN